MLVTDSIVDIRSVSEVSDSFRHFFFHLYQKWIVTNNEHRITTTNNEYRDEIQITKTSILSRKFSD